jgi:3-deoxy-D-manno-octulosonic-acid transferase
MSLLLDLGYLIAFIVAAPWILYRVVAAGGRHELAMRFGLDLGAALDGCIWLHGSSAGEVSVLKPLVALLERDLPGTPLVISTFTTTGLAAARKLYPRHRVVPFPFDFSLVVRRCLRKFAPRLVIIVESEFWPNFIVTARRGGIPVAIVNGKISAKSHRMHRRTRLIPRVLRQLSVIAVQTEEHARRLCSLGVDQRRVRITGNMKYDLARPQCNAGEARELRARLGYTDEDIVIIGGSLHSPEDEALLDAYDALAARAVPVALIIVPRYPADAEGVRHHAEQRGHRAVCKTEVDAGREPPGRGGLLIVDSVGELGMLYAIADIAFVGGSLFYRGSNKGGHNLMEPAMLAVPVLFGPYNFSFKETVEDLLAADAGFLVRDRAELAVVLADLAIDGRKRREIGERARQVVLQGQGATERNYQLVVELLESTEGRLQPSSFARKMPRAASDPDSP